MRVYLKVISLNVFIAIVFNLLCAIPDDPRENPANADIHFLDSTTKFLNSGDSAKFILEILYAKHFKSIDVSLSCGNFSFVISPDTLELIDTVYFERKFTDEGPCTLLVAASYIDQSLKNKKVQLPLYIVAGKADTDTPTIKFNTVPESFSTQTGKTDTLLFVLDSIAPSFKLSVFSVPLLSEQELILLYDSNDTVCVLFNPSLADTYSVCLQVENKPSASIEPIIKSVCVGIRVNPETPVWNTTAASIKAIEGKIVKHDLRYYVSNPLPNGVTFSSNFGYVTADTFWQWIPTWGCTTSNVVTINAKIADKEQKLLVNVTVLQGDSGKPLVRLVDETLNGKKIGSSQVTIDCVAKDSLSGISKVTMSYNDQAVEAIRKNDTVFSAVLSGLKHDLPEEITITAIDSSMKKNSGTLLFTVTFDSSIGDKEAPVFTYINGPKNGDRVVTPDGTILYKILDNSGIDSVWWTLNGNPAGALTIQADGAYLFSYSSLNFGNNHLKIYSRDKSASKNNGATEITLYYNTLITPINPLIPANGATGIGLQPQCTWDGGDDADGDTVYYFVKYGTDSLNLTGTTHEATKKNSTVGTALSSNTQYYWMVFAYTKINKDTVKSSLQTFTTAGTGPKITRQPSAVTCAVGGTITLSVTASGNPACRYQWQKDSVNLPGDTLTLLSIANAKVENTGKYRCIVSNSAGTLSSNEVLVKVLQTYTISVNRLPEAGGNVTIEKDTAVYLAGSAVKLTAVPKSGYRFDGWGGDTTVDGSSFTLTINKNRNVTAKFKRQFMLTVTSSDQAKGSVTPPSPVAVDSGAEYTIKASVVNGYKFLKWSTTTDDVLRDSTTATTTVSMTRGDVTVQGVFGCYTFEKTYERPLFVYSVAQSNDSTFFVSGYDFHDSYILKLNKYGDTTLTTQLTSVQWFTTVYSMRKCSDHGILLGVNQAYTDSNEIFAIKLALNGNEIFKWKVGGKGTRIKFAEQTSDGGVIVGGEGVDTLPWLVKLTSSGIVTWQKTYNYSGQIMDGCQTRDEGFVFTTKSDECVSTVIRTNSSGVVSWTLQFSELVILSIRQTKDGGYILGAEERSSALCGDWRPGVACLIKIDANGVVVWRKTNSIGQAINAVRQLAKEDGFVYVSTTELEGAGNGSDVYLVKTNSTGEPVWTRTFGSSEFSETGASVEETNDGGFLLIGRSSKTYIVKTDENGKID